VQRATANKVMPALLQLDVEIVAENLVQRDFFDTLE